MRSIDPIDGSTLADYEPMTWQAVVRVLSSVVEAQRAWARTSFDERAARLLATARVLRERADRYAMLATAEMGKPIRDARAEIEKCAWVCEHYAQNGASYLADEPVPSVEDRRAFVAYRPLGVILAVMPWNYPYWQVLRFAAPTLMAGNGAVLKHASNVTGCALAIEETFADAGLPKNLFRTLLVESDVVRDVIEQPSIAAVSLTGSTRAGAAVGEHAGRMVKKTVLELGGADPYLVLADADLDLAVEACATSRLLNGGQSCIAAKRFIVVEPIRAEFERRFVARMARVRPGDPRDPGTELGPMARRDLRDGLHDQVERTVRAGAELRLGGTIPDGPGAFYPPTVLAGVRPGMPAFEEELFGPVAAIVAAIDEDDAIDLANRSVFGLGAAVFTRDRARGEAIARDRIEAGSCFVNEYVKSDPRLPFGGVKLSGHGRELGAAGIRELVNIKTVVVHP